MSIKNLVFRFGIGDRVYYSPIIGGRKDGKIYTVTGRADNYGQAVYWLAEKSGFVAEEALTEAIESPSARRVLKEKK